MHFEIDVKELTKVVKLVKKVVPKNGYLPILHNVKVEITEGKVVFSATNLEISIVTSTACKTEGTGFLLIPLKVLESSVNLNGNKKTGSLSFACPVNELTVTNGNYCNTFRTDNLEEYPVIPNEEPTSELGADFTDKCIACLPAVSEDESRQTLQGVCLQPGYVVATDGRRLHFVACDNYRLFIDPAITEVMVLVQAIRLLVDTVKTEKDNSVKAGLVIEKDIPNEGNESDITSRLKSIVLQVGNTQIISKLTEGKFPTWQRVIPTETNFCIPLPRKELYESLSHSLNYQEGENEPVVIYFNTERELPEVEIYTTRTSNTGRYYAHLPIPECTLPNSFGFAIIPEFILAVLKVVKEDTVQIKLTDSVHPILLEPVPENGKKFILMPTRMDTENGIVSYRTFCEQIKTLNNIQRTKESPELETTDKSIETQPTNSTEVTENVKIESIPSVQSPVSDNQTTGEVEETITLKDASVQTAESNNETTEQVKETIPVTETINVIKEHDIPQEVSVVS